MRLRIAATALLVVMTSVLAAPDAAPTLWVHVIPTGYERGRFIALVQLVLPAAPEPRHSWELAATLASGAEPRGFASRVDADASGVRLVLEEVVSFAPGACEIRAEAHDPSTGERIARTVEVDWPDPRAAPARVGPIAVLQEATGIFVRGPRTRRSGSLGLARSEPLRPGARSAMVGIVCGGGATTLDVSRRMLGHAEMRFDDVKMEQTTHGCAVFQDLIPAGTLPAGFYRYEVRARASGGPEDTVAYRAFSAARREDRGD